MGWLKDHFGSGPLSFVIAFLLVFILAKIGDAAGLGKINFGGVWGFLFVVVSLLIMTVSVINLPVSKRSRKLVTHGIYRYVRHPIYAAGVFFLYPGIALLLKSWLALASTVLVYFIFKFMVRYEENHLLEVFGEEYRKYMEEVNGFFPKVKK